MSAKPPAMTGRTEVTIAGRPIGPNRPPYVVAELSANHAGSLEKALRIMEVAARAGADAVKLQTYTADTLTIDHDGPGFRIEEGLWAGRTLYDLYDEAHTPWEWHEPLFEKGRSLGLTVFSSPFDASAVAFLETLDAPAYKIASFEAIDIPLIEKAASTGKPLIISTGLATEGEIGAAASTAESAGASGVILLHCVSGYPTPPEDCNLATIPEMARRFGTVIGLSDHSLGASVAIAAVALGASLVEKHVTLRREDGGPDSAFSVEPDELRALIEGVRTAWRALGSVSFAREPSEAANAVFRRSLYVVEDVRAGEPLTPQNLRSIRPGYGLAPRHYADLLGRCVKHNVARGTPMSWDLLEASTKRV
jgi:pseudaminic acid synthase